MLRGGDIAFNHLSNLQRALVAHSENPDEGRRLPIEFRGTFHFLKRIPYCRYVTQGQPRSLRRSAEHKLLKIVCGIRLRVGSD